MATDRSTVLVIDDHPLFRRGVRQLLELDPQLELVGEASSGAEGVALALQRQPDLVLLDLNMKGLDGIETLARLREAGCDARIVMLTVSDAADDLLAAIRAGADGYLLKDMEPEELLARIHEALYGRMVIGESLAGVLAQALRGEAQAASRTGADLTDRERDILACLAAGMSNKLVARELDITEGTVKVHVKNLLKKLNFRSRVTGSGIVAATIDKTTIFPPPLFTDSPDRPASRILAATAYVGLALILLIVPATFYVANLEDGAADPSLVPRTLRVAAICAFFCLAGLLAFRVTALKRVRQIEDELLFRAEHDVLTGLLNRASLRKRVAEACARADRTGTTVAVMFVDLDDFKMVNDTMGHAAGDALLRDVSQRLRDGVRLGDAVARLGGDEFALVFENIHNEGAGTVAAGLLQRIRLPYTIAGRRHDLSCCIGIAMHPQDAGEPDRLLAFGNIAMQECKRRGKSDYAFYSRSMQSALEARLRLQRHVRQAWETRSFSLAYQPICDLDRARLTGAEALIRWENDDDVNTAQLVATLEDIGLIGEVGAWVIRETCRQARAWDDAGLPHFVMSVNVSPRQFRDGEALVLGVREALAETGLNPGRLQIEITEGAMMENQGESLLTLNQLKALGITIAVDDFGTGYSSLSYLKHFPVDALKIDKVFVSELSEQAAESNIVIAIVQLARGLNLAVIAEGVENEQQLALLRRYGCDLMQGYALASPLPPWQFEEDVLRSPQWLFQRTRTMPMALVARPRDDDREDRTVPAR